MINHRGPEFADLQGRIMDRLKLLVAIDRDENNVRNYNVSGALNLVTMKLVGYTEVIHTLASRM
jgi:hypothetical protein